MNSSRTKAGIAVFDSSPLIFLVRVDLLEMTIDLFSECLVPESVIGEVVGAGRELGLPETAPIENLLEKDRLLRSPVAPTALGRRLETNPRLSPADRDCLVLAVGRRARVMADDAAIRSVAKTLRLPLGGTLYALLTLVSQKVLEAAAGIEYLDRLVDSGWDCSARLYRSARGLLEGQL